LAEQGDRIGIVHLRCLQQHRSIAMVAQVRRPPSLPAMDGLAGANANPL
jgi:hypothetical protein